MATNRQCSRPSPAAGYEGVQGADPDRCRALGLVPTTFDIRPVPGGLLERARKWADQGFVCSTLMVGTGIDDDDRAAHLVEEVLEASTTAGIPLYIETHRATITQDIWRTLQLVERFPEIRFNGDFSHWYTGHDMPSGDFDGKLELLAPVLERVRYLHGRIGTGGAIQVDVDDIAAGRPAVRGPLPSLWTEAFAGFIATASDDPVPVPATRSGSLPSSAGRFGYALLVPEIDGERESRRPLGPGAGADPHCSRLLHCCGRDEWILWSSGLIGGGREWRTCDQHR